MSKFADLLADPYSYRRYLIEVHPHDIAAGAVVSRYYSTDGWTSGGADSPAHTTYEAYIVEPLNFTRSMWREGATGGRSTASYGYVVLSNAEGQMDEWLGFAVDGRQITVLLGGDGFARADYGVVYTGTMQAVEFDVDTVRLVLRGHQYRLDVPLQSTLYAGTGGWEGGADFAGRPKPLVYGIVRGYEPPVVDRVDLRVDLHDGAIEAVLGVYDSGIPLTFDADYASTAALDAATIQSGYYATCLAEGRMRLGTAPAGRVTVDMQGDASGGYVQTGGAIMARIASRASVASDGASVAALDAASPGALGRPFTDAVTVAAAMDAIAESQGAWWGFKRASDTIVYGRLIVPTGAPAAEFTEREILDCTALATALPPWRLRLGYRPCWAPMTPADLAAGASAATIDFYGAPARYVTAEDAARKATHLLAPDQTLQTLFDTHSDAKAEADRRLALYATGRRMWRMRAKTQPFSLDLGDEIRLTLPRLGLNGGKDFVVVTMREDGLVNEVEMEVWG